MPLNFPRSQSRPDGLGAAAARMFAGRLLPQSRRLNMAGLYSEGLLPSTQTDNLYGPSALYSVPDFLRDRRVNLISGGAPDQNALDAMSGYTKGISASAKTPRTYQTRGMEFSDVIKGLPGGPTPPSGLDAAAARMFAGGPLPQAPPGGLDAAAARMLADKPDAAPLGQGAEGGPQSLMGRIGGFFKRPGVGESMMAAGARMMQGSTEGTFATIGEGLEAGLDAYGEAKTARQLEEDRAVEAEERAEKARREQAARDAILGDDEFTDAEQNLLIAQVNLGDFSGAQDTKDRILDVRAMMARGEGSGVSDEDMQTIAMVMRDDPAAAAEMFSLRLDDVVTDAWVQNVIDTNAGQPEGADPALTAEEIAMLPTIPSAMARSFVMDRLKEIEQRPVLRAALRQKQFGTNPLTVADEEWLDMLVEDLDIGSSVLGGPNPTMTFGKAADGSVHVFKSGIEVDVYPPDVADKIGLGVIESLVPQTAFSDDFHAHQVEYLASRRDLNQILLDARDEDFGILNTAVDVFQRLLNTVGIGDKAMLRAQTDVEQALGTIGFQSLELFVGPTSDFESGLAKMIQGGKQLTRARFQELAARQLKQRLNLYARHNDSVERSLANLPVEAAYLRREFEAKYIRLTPEDVPVFVYDEWMGDMEARSRSGGGSRILFTGDYPVTGSPKELSEEVSEVDDRAGNFFDLGGGTSGGLGAFDPLTLDPRAFNPFGIGTGTTQGPGGPVNQSRYPWASLSGRAYDLTDRQLFPPGQGLLPQGLPR